MTNTEELNLGNSLVSLGILTLSDLSEARQVSRDLKQPLIKVLVQSQFLSQEQLVAALEAAECVSARIIEGQVARKAYSYATQKGMTFREAARELGLIKIQAVNSQEPVKKESAREVDNNAIKDVLVHSGAISTSLAHKAFESARAINQPMEEILLKDGHLPKVAAEAVAKLRALLANGTVTMLTAANILRQMRERSISLHRAMAELGLVRSSSQERLRLGELLKQAGLVKEAELAEALKLATWNDMLIGKMLVMLGYVSETTMQNALRCQFLLREGKMRCEQAIIALNYCERVRCNIEEALVEIGKTA